jgi:hypothetical protein
MDYNYTTFVHFTPRKVKKVLSLHGFTDIEIHKNHCEFSGFCTRKSDEVKFYFNSGDKRGMSRGFYSRVVDHYKDYTGKENHQFQHTSEGVNKFLRWVTTHGKNLL